jgi:hypothetical protein
MYGQCHAGIFTGVDAHHEAITCRIVNDKIRDADCLTTTSHFAKDGAAVVCQLKDGELFGCKYDEQIAKIQREGTTYICRLDDEGKTIGDACWPWDGRQQPRGQLPPNPPTPCAGICKDLFGRPMQTERFLTALGSDELCDELAATLVVGSCSDLPQGRTLTVNGKVMTCDRATWQMPAAVNGGYCLHVDAGASGGIVDIAKLP